ncbi:MAG TPA: SCP2 sterol-binding domain-containing protein [Candidatus Limnocylindria bacterium]|jgi:putative sterol carrier protein|nr:SCP2 sterol-binding domain-containing protein [Candidatus Dormibacteraeota bacterium]HYS02421.1 SCP2 sterol-binding domain-containing protein [Candidatus Eisenbacteria bacterium]HYS29935.1 SCP2 sterol-binding domain-containing protein [Candidatus Limnocylindria bacterium]
MPDAREVFTEIEKRIAAKPDKIKGLNATYQFDLTGESWTLRIQDGQLTLDSGPAESPNTTFVASTEDWMNIATGKLNAVTAFMQQKLKVKGDMALAMKLQGLLN